MRFLLVLIVTLGAYACQENAPLPITDTRLLDAGSLIDSDEPTTRVLPDVTESAHEPKAMIAIHIDPGSPALGIVHATPEHWQRLVGIVKKADALGFKLTLLMGPDWVDLIKNNEMALQTIKSWVSAGHQLGYHHHTCGHTTPDGYRDVKNDPCKGVPDSGSVSIAFGKVRDFGATLGPQGKVEIAAQGTDPKGKYRAAEWQQEAVYATGPMADNSDGSTDHRFITVPRCTASYGNRYGGQKVVFSVPEIGHAQLDIGGFIDNQQLNNLAALREEIEIVQDPEHRALGAHIGLVFHAREYADTPRQTDRDDYPTDKAYIDAIFESLADQGIEVLTARELLDAANPCGNP